MPWLFENRLAWERTVSDSRVRYTMGFDAFMEIYREHLAIVLRDSK